MKIQLEEIRNDVLNAESNPELKFLLEFELQKNIHIKVPFYYDCVSSQLFLTAISLTTMKVENRPFEFGVFSKNSLLKMIMKIRLRECLNGFRIGTRELLLKVIR